MCALRKLLKKEVEMEGKRGLMEGKMYFGEGPGREYWDSLGGLQHCCTLQTWTIPWLPGLDIWDHKQMSPFC